MRLFRFKLLLAFVLLTVLVNGQVDYTTIRYRGIRPDDYGGFMPIRNPGRGFRLEDTLDLSKMGVLLRSHWDSTSNLKMQALKYVSDSVSLVQTTLYLPETPGIPDTALKGIQIYFDTLKMMGMKSVLQLTYKKAPRQADVIRHLEQLQPLLQRNKGLILAVQDNIADNLIPEKFIQLGILKKIVSVVPSPIMVQVRLPETKNLIVVGDPYYDRVGFYDDMIMGKPDKADLGIHSGTPSFEQLVRESAATIMDGALPPGNRNPGKGSTLTDGYKTAPLLRLLHMTSISLIRNNAEEGMVQKSALENWHDVPVGPEQLLALKLPYSEDYFKSSRGGEIIQRPLYDYIRDYLGYRIELKQLVLPVKRTDNSPVVLKLEVVNQGFSAVKHPCSVAFVLIDPTDKVYEMPTEADPTSWQPFATGDLNFKPLSYTVQYSGKLPLHLMPGRYKLGLWIADAATDLHYDYRYDIRCANGNMGWWISRDGRYGINILTSLTISK